MAKKVAKMGHAPSKTQPKKIKDCDCDGKMDWVYYAGDGDKGMRFFCNKCGRIDRG